MKVVNVYISGNEDHMMVGLSVAHDNAGTVARPPIAIPADIREAIIEYLTMEKVG